MTSSLNSFSSVRPQSRPQRARRLRLAGAAGLAASALLIVGGATTAAVAEPLPRTDTVPGGPWVQEVTAQMNPRQAVEFAIADAEHVHLHQLLRDVHWTSPTDAQAWMAEGATAPADSVAAAQLTDFAAARGVNLQILAAR
ncbi:hypothetical protein [Corynebacterium heidelbergense]|uniref:Uncharacterized protein n=1 Tax=Corynebacterium heidelbergense TaxID=2055947 RepID=A0A364VCF7_9CORY|nr:hypothetical protein [Corynebacterium heidelbergense]RAV34288.1 hypothetical protein CWC39_04090 [Corynebacterium heidelbergense]WCZ35987.1 hypothetical protein CHEID_02100 [Corynebacterium heidelbergense]